jgi:hypothetical protein
MGVRAATVARVNHVIVNRAQGAASRSATQAATGFEAEAAGHVLCALTRQEIADFRRRPGPLPEGWAPVQPSVLRQSDDQTITALAALTRLLPVLDNAHHRSLDRWGLLTAGRFVGRSNLVIALNRFRAEGVWGVSPHLIPHYALHSPSGTLSLALGLHGPNLGIGGGLFSGFEGLLTALTWLKGGIVPGVCLVFCGWHPEYVPDPQGEPINECRCLALALALVPASSTAGHIHRPRLRLAASQRPAAPFPLDLAQVGELLDRSQVDQPERNSLLPPGLSLHAAHEGSAIPRPHLFSKAVPAVRSRTLATDATGRLRVELVMPPAHGGREKLR